MLTLMPSMSVGLVAGVLTAILLAVDWYIWDISYWISRQRAPEFAPSADGKDLIHMPSASGRELVVTLAPQSPDRNTLPIHQVDGEWRGVWAQG